MSEIIIDLSPINGYDRKAIFRGLFYNRERKYVSTQWQVRMFDEEGNELTGQNAPWYQSYAKEFIADESTWVDPVTGDYVEEGTEGAVTEWHYFSEIVANNLVNVNEMIEAVGSKKALEGKFEHI